MLLNNYSIDYQMYKHQNDSIAPTLKLCYESVLPHIDDMKPGKYPFQDVVLLSWRSQRQTYTVQELVVNTFLKNIAVSNPSFIDSWRGWTTSNLGFVDYASTMMHFRPLLKEFLLKCPDILNQMQQFQYFGSGKSFYNVNNMSVLNKQIGIAETTKQPIDEFLASRWFGTKYGRAFVQFKSVFDASNSMAQSKPVQTSIQGQDSKKNTPIEIAKDILKGKSLSIDLDNSELLHDIFDNCVKILDIKKADDVFPKIANNFLDYFASNEMQSRNYELFASAVKLLYQMPEGNEILLKHKCISDYSTITLISELAL